MCAIKSVMFGNEKSDFFKDSVNKFGAVSVHGSSPSGISVNYQQASEKKQKALTYASSAVALAALGIAGYSLSRNYKNIKSFKQFLATTSQELQALKTETSKISKKIGKVSGEVDRKITEVANQNKHNQALLNNKLEQIGQKYADSSMVFNTRKVTVDGLVMDLGTTISEITGKVEEKMRNILRTESTKRILGLTDKLQDVPKFSVVRIPTAELVPFTQSGGLAVVPKDIAANLAAVMNGSQKGALILDTPLYTGQVVQDQFLSKVPVISELTGKFEGKYDYIRKILSPRGVTSEKIASMREVQELNIPIYTDTGVVKEKVGVFITDVMEAPVDWQSLKQRLSKDVKKEISTLIKEGKAYETDFIRVVKNPSTQEIESYGKFRTVLYDSPKFDLSAKLLNEGEKFNLYRNDTLATGETERMIYFSKFFTEQLYHADESKYILKALDMVDEAGKFIINPSTGKPKKEFVKLGADAIIGNDWHTGPISAILRQLSTVKKYYGMDPQKADKLQNIPIMTILHNVEYQGGVGHSQEKLLNIMFGEHTAKIVENAFMPDIAVRAGSNGLPKHLWNSMMVGRDINPQMMAASYSDILIPVSEKYSEEIASHSGFGKACHDIFKLRARNYEYGDLDYVKSIATRNNLDASKVTGTKTLVGINNGCDTSNNILSSSIARKMEKDLQLKPQSIVPYSKDVKILDWHNNNKGIYLEKVVQEVEQAKSSLGKDNPMKLYMPELTDLSGVTVDTPVFALAGRLEDQKGLNILAKGIVEFYKNYKGSNPPIFYTQGLGVTQEYINYLLEAKAEVAKFNPAAAKRIVVAGLFKEPSRYNGCKIMSDFTNMPSWFEPFGLVHKENAKFNGSIPIVNEVGGLTANLTDMLNALFVKYQHRFDPNINAVEINGKNLAQIFEKAIKIYEDKPKFAKMLEESINADHGWLVKDGPIDKYVKLLVDMNVLPKSILHN